MNFWVSWGLCAFGPPGLPGPPIPAEQLASSDSSEDLGTIFLSTYSYLENSTDVILIDPSCSWAKIFRHLHLVEVDGHQDLDELAHLLD